MKFSVLQQDLLPILQAVARSVGVRSTLPVLDNILLSLQGKKLKVAATNLEIGVIKYINVEAEQDGEVTMPAKTLVELISGLGPDKITLTSESDILTVKSGKLKASMNGISAAEFPAIPLASEKGISFPKESFLSLSQILFAAALDEGRPVLTGVLTEASNEKLDFVATDGFRLAHRQIKLPDGKEKFKSLVPRRTFEELLRILAEESPDTVSVATSGHQNQIVFTLGSTVVSSRLIEGQFPAWGNIIPQKIVSRALVGKEELVSAIKLAAIFAKNETNIVILTTKPNLLKLQSQAKEVGSQENEVEGEIEGEELTIAFNAKFLLDAISNAPSTQVMMEFSGPLSAALIKPIGVEGLEYIIMPVRLS